MSTTARCIESFESRKGPELGAAAGRARGLPFLLLRETLLAARAVFFRNSDPEGAFE